MPGAGSCPRTLTYGHHDKLGANELDHIVVKHNTIGAGASATAGYTLQHPVTDGFGVGRSIFCGTFT